MNASGTIEETKTNYPEKALFTVLFAISFCHLLNDMVQSLLPSIYPILKSSFHLNFTHLGYLTFTYLIIASLLQELLDGMKPADGAAPQPSSASAAAKE